MSTFLITFAVFVAVIAAMSIGYIIQKKVVKGSCGGLGAVGIEKKYVTAQNRVTHAKKREAREAARAEKLAAWEKDRIA